jgi:hypothetical protein
MLAITGETATRRISSNLKWLHNQKFISLSPRAGHTPLVTLLDPLGSGDKYSRPADQQQRYITLPLEFWSEGWILVLSATALALLMVVLDVQRGQRDFAYATSVEKEAYGLSSDTWTQARKELEKFELLDVRSDSRGSSVEYIRKRNLYRVNLDRLKMAPDW